MPTEHSSILRHDHAFSANFQKSIELCAGIAAVTEGYAECGVKTSASVEQSSAFVNILRSRGGQVVHGDIASDSVAQNLASHKAGFLSSVVSRQPFSTLGDMKMQHDDRARSFPATLKIMCLLQIPVAILECTEQAMTSEWAQGLLKVFCHAMGLVANRFLNIGAIPEFPKIPFRPSILHLIPRLCRPDELEVDELILLDNEVSEFGQRPTMDRHMCDICKPFPTATRSWGSQLQPCPCGCRYAKGLYGQLTPVPAGSSIQGQFGRQSATSSCAGSSTFEWFESLKVEDQVGSQRLMLAAVGQMAGLWPM